MGILWRASARIVEFKMQITTTTITVDVRTSKGGIDGNLDLPNIKSKFISFNKACWASNLRLFLRYSDSENEDRLKTYDPSGWARLASGVGGYHSVNPDTVFGAISTLRMDDIFL
jgi:hypothetical protein